MLRALGAALVQAGRATNETDEILHRSRPPTGGPRSASSSCRPRSSSSSSATRHTPRSIRSTCCALRLDQIGAIEKLTNETLSRRLEPQVVLDRLQQIWAPSRATTTSSDVIGHVVLTLGFGMALEPTVKALPAYAMLGPSSAC